MNPDRLARGVEALRGLGYDVRMGDDLLARRRFAAGTPERRLQELHGLFADDTIAAIVCARGGAGASHVVAHLDRGLVRAHPKIFMGYSDVTTLHLALQRAGLVTFHGPMVAVEFASGAVDAASLAQALGGIGGLYASSADDLVPLRSGVGTGRLRGGCLSLLAAASGTPWALETDGDDTILFVEDVDEPPYRIDRMLRQLRAAGALGGVRGIVFGDMKGCSPSADADYGLEDVIAEALAGLDVPIAMGLSSGHASGPQVTLPLGVRARLACGDEARFEILEPAVA